MTYPAGSQKKLIWQQIEAEPLSDVEWTWITKNLTANNNPILAWNDQYYEFVGGSDLSSFKLKNITSGAEYPLTILDSTAGKQVGAIAVNHKVLSLRQDINEADRYRITLDLVGETSYDLVTSAGLELDINNPSMDFISSLEATPEAYTIALGGGINSNPASDTIFDLIKVTLSNPEGETIFIATLPKGTQAKEILLPNGDVVKVDVYQHSDGINLVVRLRS